MKIVLLAIVLGISGCASYDIAKPLNPDSGWPHKLTEVESLTPTLEWAPDFDGPADLILFEGAYTSNGYLMGGEQSEPKSIVYVESKIEGNKHKVKQQLEPNRSYFWAVRPHSESAGNDWSNYEYFAFYGIAFAYFIDQLFIFKTPNIKN
ncbi:MAG: hypothetical protein R3183_04860 [Oleiphilaceae bacterium]|nr:hypothetical protein [Oleiphilaceae bacterium]